AERAGDRVVSGGSQGPQGGDVIVAVLAAGRSSRMGFPKALADLGGETALARLLRIARAQRLRALVVLGFHEQEIVARCGRELAGVQLVVNHAPERGQSSSARLAAQSVADGGSLALWPVDHARVQEATFERLLAAFRARAPGIELVVPSCDGRRGHPLFLGPLARRELAALADDEPAHVVVRKDPGRVLHVV